MDRSTEISDRKVAVALSGGVDSAAAAIILRREGFELAGLTMTIGAPGDSTAVETAVSIARSLRIDHRVVDLRRRFTDEVILPFVGEYARGRTPNPCVSCNRRIKFGALIDEARRLGCDRLATGHYARIEQEPEGWYRMLRAVDRKKDQTYFLWALFREELRRVLTPVGGIPKEEASRLVSEAGLRTLDRQTQDICFVAGDSYVSLLERRAPGSLKPGPILDLSGSRIGEHGGVARYTVGQRRGLLLEGTQAAYVLEIRPEQNALVVGGADHLSCDGFTANDLNFLAGAPPSERFECLVQIRYRGTPVEAVVLIRRKGDAEITYREKGPLAAPGQSAAFYRGAELLGGGVIKSVK